MYNEIPVVEFWKNRFASSLLDLSLPQINLTPSDTCSKATKEVVRGIFLFQIWQRISSPY